MASGRNDAKQNRRAKEAFRPAVLILTLILMMAIAVLSSCGSSGAEAKVRADLDSLQNSEAAGSRLTSIQEFLSKDAGEDLETFLSKVREFDYEIIGSEEKIDGDDKYTLVTVKIVSCDFGREYLATWKDYLREHEDASTEDADGREFYDELFGRLSGLEDKQYISFVEIRAMEPMDNDEWVTDISANEDLQDALFGGMIGEMKALAGE